MLDFYRFKKIRTAAWITMVAIFIMVKVLPDYSLSTSLAVLLGVIAVFMVFFVLYRIKTLFIETYLAMAVCLLIDVLTGWHGWSLAYVLPIGFVLLVFVTISVGRGAKLRLEEYIIYIFVTILLSMLQIIPVLTHVNPNILPAVVSMAILLIAACAAVIFRFRDLWSAVEKMFNL